MTERSPRAPCRPSLRRSTRRPRPPAGRPSRPGPPPSSARRPTRRRSRLTGGESSVIILLHRPLPFGRRFNRNGEGASAKLTELSSMAVPRPGQGSPSGSSRSGRCPGRGSCELTAAAGILHRECSLQLQQGLSSGSAAARPRRTHLADGAAVVVAGDVHTAGGPAWQHPDHVLRLRLRGVRR